MKSKTTSEKENSVENNDLQIPIQESFHGKGKSDFFTDNVEHSSNGGK